MDPIKTTLNFMGKQQKSLIIQKKNVIFVGDFNLVLNPELDYSNYLHINNPKGKRKSRRNDK